MQSMIPSPGKRSLMVATGVFGSDGGIAGVNRLVVRSLSERGYQISVFVLNEDKVAPDPQFVDPSMVDYRTFGGNKITFALAVWTAVITTRYDLIICDHVNIASLLAPLSIARRCRYIVWLCGIEVFWPRPDQLGRMGLTWAWKRLAISDYTRKAVGRHFPHLPVSVCDLCLDPVRHKAVQSERDNKALRLTAIEGTEQELGQQVLLHVGRMASRERYKGQDSVLHSFPSILRRFPGAQLVLAGQGDDKKRLEAIARGLESAAQSRIFMPGYVDNDMLERLYKICCLFVMPSTGEGFGLAYLEAMSKAKPCIGGKVDATPCVVLDGVTGVLVDDPTSAEQVGDAVGMLLAHPEEATRMGMAGYDRVCSRFLFRHFEERFWSAILE